MKAQHTPGPWDATPGADFSGEYWIKKVYDAEVHGKEHEANARLIAAAPEMLEALRRIAESEPRPNRKRCYDPDVVEGLQRIARIAIRKATEYLPPR